MALSRPNFYMEFLHDLGLSIRVRVGLGLDWIRVRVLGLEG